MAGASDGKIYTLAQQTEGGRWKAWTTLAPQKSPRFTPSGFVAGNTRDGRLQLFATDEKGIVYSMSQQTPGREWQSRWTQIGSRNGLAFAP